MPRRDQRKSLSIRNLQAFVRKLRWLAAESGVPNEQSVRLDGIAFAAERFSSTRSTA